MTLEWCMVDSRENFFTLRLSGQHMKHMPSEHLCYMALFSVLGMHQYILTPHAYTVKPNVFLKYLMISWPWAN